MAMQPLIKKSIIGLMTFLLIGCGSFFIRSPISGTDKDGRFIAYDNGTVVDTRSGLMWAAEDNGKGVNWLEAKSYCENYLGGGYNDWRMPTQDELAGLYDASKTYGYFCQGFLLFYSCQHVYLTDLIHLTGEWVFASEIRNSEYAFVYAASGHPGWVRPKRAIGGRVLPVRSVK
jgi:hypothetical protein